MDEAQQNEAERVVYEAAVEGLAKSQGVAAEEVQSLYESALADLQRGATIMDFLPIFAARRVKETLLDRKTRRPTA